LFRALPGQFDSGARLAHNSRGVTPQIPFETKIAA